MQVYFFTNILEVDDVYCDVKYIPFVLFFFLFMFAFYTCVLSCFDINEITLEKFVFPVLTDNVAKVASTDQSDRQSTHRAIGPHNKKHFEAYGKMTLDIILINMNIFVIVKNV